MGMKFVELEESFNGHFSENENEKFSGEFSEVLMRENDETSIYTGKYVVTPKVGEEIVLPTRDMKMKDDVTVNEVPIYRTRNARGNTVYRRY